jgi:hypothetical protein
MSKRTKIDDQAPPAFERGAEQPNGGKKEVKVPRHKLPVDHPDYESLAMKFRRLANKRVPVAIKRLHHVRALFNKSQYSFDAEQGEKVLAAVRDAVKQLEDAIRGNTRKPQEWSL